jgi:hypothetical protein
MEQVLKSARRRMVGQSWLNHAVWCLTLGVSMAAIALAVVKFRPELTSLEPIRTLAAGAGGGIVLALVIACLRRPDRLTTAVSVDNAFGLKDRLGSTVALSEDLAETPAGKCLKRETEKSLETIDLATGLAFRRPRRLWMPLAPLAVAALVVFTPDYLAKRSQARTTTARGDESVGKKSEALAKKLAEQRKAQAENVSAPTAELMAELQKAAEDLAKSPPAEKSEALAALNQLSDAVKDRQKQLGSTEKMASQLQQLKSMASDGPADEFAKDIAKGRFEEAAQELKTLAEKAQKGTLSQEDKEKLQQQLGDMAKQLDKMAGLEEKKKQLEEALKNGGLSKEQFQEEMAKLNQQAANMKQLQQLAQQMQQAQQAMQQGNMQQASDNLAQAQQQLQQMAQQMQEMQSLDEALAQLQEAKDSMALDGAESNQLGDAMQGGNSLGDMLGNMPNANGMGRGRGQGDREEAPDKTSSYDTRVKAELGKGKYQLKGFGQPGEQSKGKSVIEGGDVEAAVAEASADALINQRIPKKLQNDVREYFDRIRQPQ